MNRARVELRTPDRAPGSPARPPSDPGVGRWAFDVRCSKFAPGGPAPDTARHPSPLPEPARHPRPARRHAAFTLLEVVLALSLAVGLLAVVLVFYQQIARLRDQTLADTAGLAAVRLGMDRLATELRTALPRPGTFRGGPQELEFVRCVPPNSDATTLAGSSGNPSARFPLRRLHYRLAGSDPTNTPPSETAPSGGLERIEESAFSPSSLSSSIPGSQADSAAPSDDATIPPGPEAASVIPPTPPADALPAANYPGSRTALVIPELRYLALRYWDGVAWQESWDGPNLPRGVEISLATEAPPASSPPGTLPLELFRRVVALPTAPFDSPAATNDLAGVLVPVRREDPGP